jgi:hypothetical protein
MRESPSEKSLMNAFKISLQSDMPIQSDYWKESQMLDEKGRSKAFIGIKEDNEKLLVKSAEEYTSPITKIYKSESEYIILSENTIYIVDVKISQKKITN